MVQVLLIGDDADDWAERLGGVASQNLQLEAASRPAAGIRSFASTPPDAVVIVADDADRRVAAVIDALRERPLAELIPILVVAPEGDSSFDPPVSAHLSGDADPTDLRAALEEALETELTPDSPQAAAETTDGEAASYLDGDVVLEPLDDESTAETPVDDDAIDQMLQIVRHDDYFAILDVPHSADAQHIRQAYHRRRRRFAPDELDVQLVERRRGALDEIRDALDDAFAVLADPELRKRHRR